MDKSQKAGKSGVREPFVAPGVGPGALSLRGREAGGGGPLKLNPISKLKV